MNGIYEWVRSLVSYMILMTMIMNLLPNRNYEKYIRLFAGMVFLLLVVSPFTDLTGTAARMAGAFERITFQTDARLLKKEIEDLDGARFEQLAVNYKKVVGEELRTMAEREGFTCPSVELAVHTDLDSMEFGVIRGIHMVVKTAQAASKEEKQKANRKVSELRGKIGEYYGVEAGNITIMLETE